MGGERCVAVIGNAGVCHPANKYRSEGGAGGLGGGYGSEFGSGIEGGFMDAPGCEYAPTSECSDAKFRLRCPIRCSQRLGSDQQLTSNSKFFVEDKGSTLCGGGYAIMGANKCKEACKALNLPQMQIHGSNLCYKDNEGKCYQDGQEKWARNRYGVSLICEKVGLEGGAEGLEGGYESEFRSGVQGKALTDPIDSCIQKCVEEACAPDIHLQNGCNQMFSCSHGCQMRALGLDKESCNMKCDRNGQSGCYPTVNGYKFHLCKTCSREGCAKWPKVEECEVGCNSYDGLKIFGCGSSQIALKSYHGKYVVAESNGHANANRVNRGPWEIFSVEELKDGSIALKSHHGKYLVAENNYEVNANRNALGPWEKFKVLKQADGTYAFRTWKGRYLVAESDGRLRADRTRIKEWESFKVECIVGVEGGKLKAYQGCDMTKGVQGNPDCGSGERCVAVIGNAGICEP